MLQTLFAGLSVLLGSLSLVIGIQQLLSWRRSHVSTGVIDLFELEAGLPQVTAIILMRQHA